MRNIVLTASYGGYDALRTPDPVAPGWEYHAFTDEINPAPGWQIHRSLPREPGMHRKMRAKYAKIQPFRIFPDVTWVLWLDANMRFRHTDILAAIGHDPAEDNHPRPRPDAELYFCRHPERDCLYDELDVCEQRRLDALDKIQRTRELCQQLKVPRHAGLWAAGISLRRNTPFVRNICQLWWEMVCAGTWRDQPALAAVLLTSMAAVHTVLTPMGDLYEGRPHQACNHMETVDDPTGVV